MPPSHSFSRSLSRGALRRSSERLHVRSVQASPQGLAGESKDGEPKENFRRLAWTVADDLITLRREFESLRSCMEAHGFSIEAPGRALPWLGGDADLSHSSAGKSSLLGNQELTDLSREHAANSDVIQGLVPIAGNSTLSWSGSPTEMPTSHIVSTDRLSEAIVAELRDEQHSLRCALKTEQALLRQELAAIQTQLKQSMAPSGSELTCVPESVENEGHVAATASRLDIVEEAILSLSRELISQAELNSTLQPELKRVVERHEELDMVIRQIQDQYSEQLGRLEQTQLTSEISLTKLQDVEPREEQVLCNRNDSACNTQLPAAVEDSSMNVNGLRDELDELRATCCRVHMRHSERLEILESSQPDVFAALRKIEGEASHKASGIDELHSNARDHVEIDVSEHVQAELTHIREQQEEVRASCREIRGDLCERLTRLEAAHRNVETLLGRHQERDSQHEAANDFENDQAKDTPICEQQEEVRAPCREMEGDVCERLTRLENTHSKMESLFERLQERDSQHELASVLEKVQAELIQICEQQEEVRASCREVQGELCDRLTRLETAHSNLELLLDRLQERDSKHGIANCFENLQAELSIISEQQVEVRASCHALRGELCERLTRLETAHSTMESFFCRLPVMDSMGGLLMPRYRTEAGPHVRTSMPCLHGADGVPESKAPTCQSAGATGFNVELVDGNSPCLTKEDSVRLALQANPCMQPSEAMRLWRTFRAWRSQGASGRHILGVDCPFLAPDSTVSQRPALVMPTKTSGDLVLAVEQELDQHLAWTEQRLLLKAHCAMLQNREEICQIVHDELHSDRLSLPRGLPSSGGTPNYEARQDTTQMQREIGEMRLEVAHSQRELESKLESTTSRAVMSDRHIEDMIALKKSVRDLESEVGRCFEENACLRKQFSDWPEELRQSSADHPHKDMRLLEYVETTFSLLKSEFDEQRECAHNVQAQMECLELHVEERMKGSIALHDNAMPAKSVVDPLSELHTHCESTQPVNTSPGKNMSAVRRKRDMHESHHLPLPPVPEVDEVDSPLPGLEGSPWSTTGSGIVDRIEECTKRGELLVEADDLDPVLPGLDESPRGTNGFQIDDEAPRVETLDEGKLSSSGFEALRSVHKRLGPNDLRGDLRVGSSCVMDEDGRSGKPDIAIEDATKANIDEQRHAVHLSAFSSDARSTECSESFGEDATAWLNAGESSSKPAGVIEGAHECTQDMNRVRNEIAAVKAEIADSRKFSEGIRETVECMLLGIDEQRSEVDECSKCVKDLKTTVLDLKLGKGGRSREELVLQSWSLSESRAAELNTKEIAAEPQCKGETCLVNTPDLRTSVNVLEPHVGNLSQVECALLPNGVVEARMAQSEAIEITNEQRRKVDECFECISELRAAICKISTKIGEHAHEAITRIPDRPLESRSTQRKENEITSDLRSEVAECLECMAEMKTIVRNTSSEWGQHSRAASVGRCVEPLKVPSSQGRESDMAREQRHEIGECFEQIAELRKKMGVLGAQCGDLPAVEPALMPDRLMEVRSDHVQEHDVMNERLMQTCSECIEEVRAMLREAESEHRGRLREELSLMVDSLLETKFASHGDEAANEQRRKIDDCVECVAALRAEVRDLESHGCVQLREELSALSDRIVEARSDQTKETEIVIAQRSKIEECFECTSELRRKIRAMDSLYLGQSQEKDLMNEHRNKTEECSNFVAELYARIGELDVGDSSQPHREPPAMQDSLLEARSALTTTERELLLDGLGKITTVAQDMDLLRYDLGEQREQAAAQATTLCCFESKADAAEATCCELIAQLESQIEAKNSQVESIERARTEVSSDLQNFKEQWSTLHTNLSDNFTVLRAEVVSTTERILENSHEVQNQFAEVQAEVQNASNRIYKFRNELAETRGALADLQECAQAGATMRRTYAQPTPKFQNVTPGHDCEVLLLQFPSAPWPLPTSFEEELRSNLRSLGIECMADLTINFQEGVVVAELRGPQAALEELQSFPLLELEVLGHHVGLSWTSWMNAYPREAGSESQRPRIPMGAKRQGTRLKEQKLSQDIEEHQHIFSTSFEHLHAGTSSGGGPRAEFNEHTGGIGPRSPPFRGAMMAARGPQEDTSLLVPQRSEVKSFDAEVPLHSIVVRGSEEIFRNVEEWQNSVAELRMALERGWAADDAQPAATISSNDFPRASNQYASLRAAEAALADRRAIVAESAAAAAEELRSATTSVEAHVASTQSAVQNVLSEHWAQQLEIQELEHRNAATELLVNVQCEDVASANVALGREVEALRSELAEALSDGVDLRRHVLDLSLSVATPGSRGLADIDIETWELRWNSLERDEVRQQQSLAEVQNQCSDIVGSFGQLHDEIQRIAQRVDAGEQNAARGIGLLQRAMEAARADHVELRTLVARCFQVARPAYSPAFDSIDIGSAVVSNPGQQDRR